MGYQEQQCILLELQHSIFASARGWVTGLPTCPGCSFEASCVYPYVFETAPDREGGIQQPLLQMGGLIGSLSLPLAWLEPFWPFPALGPWVHVGKGATIGLGAMRVAAA